VACAREKEPPYHVVACWVHARPILHRTASVAPTLVAYTSAGFDKLGFCGTILLSFWATSSEAGCLSTVAGFGHMLAARRSRNKKHHGKEVS